MIGIRFIVKKGVVMSDLGSDLSRREAFRLLAGGVALSAVPLAPSLAGDGPGRLTLRDCVAMGPLAMAKSSATASACFQFLEEQAATLNDPALRRVVGSLLADPVPTLLRRFASDADREQVRRTLIEQRLLAADVTLQQLFPPARNGAAAQPFLSAPGSGYASHHAYPGGLPVHVAFNTRSALALSDAYRANAGIALDRDMVVAAQLLHDLHKPWVFQWTEDGALLPEYTIAGTGAHHILGIAESLVRGVPAHVVVAQASTHDHPGSPADEAKTVAYLKAGAIIAGRDAVEAGLLAPDGASVPLPRRIENFVAHLGDHDWILAGPVNGWDMAVLKEIARRDYAPAVDDVRTFNALRNYVFSQLTMIGAHQLYCTGGVAAVRERVNALVAPV